MPEGPSIVILKEAVQQFKGKKPIKISGNTKVDLDKIRGKKITDFKSWGKHFLICFDDVSVRIHFLLFGSYRINETKNSKPRLQFKFRNGELNFYACSVKIIEEDLNKIYDWPVDLMSEKWSPVKVRTLLKENPNMLVCDALLDQAIFAGSGNIIKNEVLFRIRVHPLSKVGELPPNKLRQLILEARHYSFDFLRWKKEYVLKKHWLAHTKKICPRCNIPFIKEYLGRTRRRTYYCSNCQQLYS